MSHLRQDPLRGHWVVINESRQGRPDEFAAGPSMRRDLRCPFCEGNEDATPRALAEYPTPGDPAQWQARVVPNKYPAFAEGANGVSTEAVNGASSAFHERSSAGRHEVIIESRRHISSFAQLTQAEAELAPTIFRDRLLALSVAPGVEYGFLFKNTGADAGASIEHTHSQLIGMRFLPPEVQLELQNCRDHYDKTGRGLLAEILARELVTADRMIVKTEHFAAFAPYASRFPYQVWVAPLVATPRFEHTPAEQLHELGRMLRDLTARIEASTGGASHNLLLHTAPLKNADCPGFGWRIEIFPRITRQAGLEWGSGVFINTVSPETAAAALRN